MSLIKNNNNITDLFYNNKTEFEDDILINDNVNVEYINIPTKKKKEKGEINIIDGIKKDEIEYIDEETDEFKDFIKTVKITRVVHNDFVDYTDDQFKNNILLLTKDNVNNNNAIPNVNNLLNVFNKLKNKTITETSDKLFYPIINIKKKVFLIDTEKYMDGSNNNNNISLIKTTVEDYLSKNNNISFSNEPYDIKENRLYQLERPFEPLADSESNGFKYIPYFNRDAISNCITENIENYNKDDFKCVDILNNPKKLDKFRILSKKVYKVTDEDIRQLYSGDEVRIVGYVNKIPSSEEEIVNIFDLEQYYNDIEDIKDNDEIFIKLTINNNNTNYVGKIISSKDNLINIKLNKEIVFIDNKKTDLLTYDKNSVNYFTLYPKNEKNNIFDKISLFNENIPTVFKFPEIFNKEDYDKYKSLIFPNLKELLLNNDNFINYNELNNLLDKYNFDINNLDKHDISTINIKLNQNIKAFTEKNNKGLKVDKINKVRKKFKSSNLLLEKFPEHYNNYLDTDLYKDTNINRTIYLNKQNDKGFFHYIFEMKKTLEKELDEIKDIDFEEELKIFQKEYNKLEIENKKYKPDDCKQIIIEKIYYNSQNLEKDEGKKNNFEKKYVILNEGNMFSTIYQMNNGSWVKKMNLEQSERDNIKLCDGKYYYTKLDKNICMYDDITSLCKKRDQFINIQNLNKLVIQINIINELKDFSNNFKKYNKFLDNLLNIYKIKIHNSHNIKQITYEKITSDKKYTGDEDFIDFDTIYNNFEVMNDPFYIPIDNIFSGNSIEDKKNEYEKLINKILQVSGFEISKTEIRHIVKSIDNINQKILQKKINQAKKDTSEYANLTDKEVISKLYNNKAEQRSDIHKNIILIIASMLIIIIQIQYPNVKLVSLNSKCSKFFSLLGYPIEKSSKENMKKQLYVYIGCCLFIGLKEELNNLSNTLVLNKIQQIIRIILKERPYYITLLKNNKRIFDEVKDRDFKIKVWAGYKPELIIKKEPLTTVGKYLYNLSQNMNKAKIQKFDYLKRPLINNICCYDKITKDLNYYNYYSDKFTDKNTIIKNIKDNEKNIGIYTSETFFNLIRNTGFKYNFDSDYIFNPKDKLNFNNLELFESDKFDTSDYFDYSKVFNKLFENNKFINDDLTIKDLLENKNFNDDNRWENFSSNIQTLFNRLINFTKTYAINFDDDIIKDLESYLVSLRTEKKSISIENLFNIKNISQKWITYKISYLLSKIINFKPVDIDSPALNQILSNNDKIKISNIIHNTDKELIGYNDSITENDIIKNNFNNNFNIFNIESYKINLDDNSNKNNDINNITKNIYLLNYFFIKIIYNIYTLILKQSDGDENIPIDTIFDRISVFISSEEIDENKTSQLTLISNIVFYILKEYRDTIKNNLIDNDELQSTVNSLREDKKQRQIRYFENLTLDDVDAHKLLKEIGHRIDINEDYYEDKEVQELILENPKNQDNIIFGEEIGDNDMLINSDYQGENSDELDEDFM